MVFVGDGQGSAKSNFTALKVCLGVFILGGVSEEFLCAAQFSAILLDLDPYARARCPTPSVSSSSTQIIFRTLQSGELGGYKPLWKWQEHLKPGGWVSLAAPLKTGGGEARPSSLECCCAPPPRFVELMCGESRWCTSVAGGSRNTPFLEAAVGSRRYREEMLGKYGDTCIWSAVVGARA